MKLHVPFKYQKQLESKVSSKQINQPLSDKELSVTRKWMDVSFEDDAFVHCQL